MDDSEKYRQRFERERNARKQAEQIAEKKTRELFVANQQMKQLTINLEDMIAFRTGELEIANQMLREEISERKKADAERSILYGQMQENLVRTEALYRVSQLLIAVESLDSVLRSLVESVVDAERSDLVQLIGVDMKAQKVLYSFGDGPGKKPYARSDLSRSETGFEWMVHAQSETGHFSKRSR